MVSPQLATSVPDLQYCPLVLNACDKCECLCAQFSLLCNESWTCRYRWQGVPLVSDIAGPARARISASPGRRTNMFSLQTRNNYNGIRHQTCEHRSTTEYTVFPTLSRPGGAWPGFKHLCQIIFIYLLRQNCCLFCFLYFFSIPFSAYLQLTLHCQLLLNSSFVMHSLSNKFSSQSFHLFVF